MTTEISVVEASVEVGVNAYGSLTPQAIVETATQQADVLARVIEDRKLYAVTGRDRKTGEERRHVQVEGWQTLGAMLGVFAIVEWSRHTPDAFQPFIGKSEWYTDDGGRNRKRMNLIQGGAGGWEARVHLIDRDGRVVGAAEAECRWEEDAWAERDSYALRSMAQTRATGKAFRGTFAFVMSLAGFEPTPLDEIPVEGARLPTDLHNLPPAADPAAWGKTVAVMLANGDVDEGKKMWEQVKSTELGEGEKVDKGNVQALVAAMHTIMEAPASDG